MRYPCILLFMLLLQACKKFLVVPPPPDLATTTEVFSNDANATAAVLSIYDNMNNAGLTGTFLAGYYDLSLTCGRSADELDNHDGSKDMLQVSRNMLLPDNAAVYTIWSGCYQTIYSANAVLAGLNGSNGVSPGLRAELEGEAKFIRAFCHFYLTNLFGDVPVITGIDYRANTLAKKSSQADVYRQIVGDLLDARTGLSAGYRDAANGPSSERVRPVQAAAAALLARVYLYTKDYTDAAAQAGWVISQASLYSLTSLDSVFLKNSHETIWSLQPPEMTGVSTFDAEVFIITSPDDMAVTLSPSMMDAFEPGDGRRQEWVGDLVDSSSTDLRHYYYPYKYKESAAPAAGPGEYIILLRLAEQYLIRAEARALTGDINGAISDLHIVRARAGLPQMPGLTAGTLPGAILHERQVELFSEQGHRWLDLKRTNSANAVLAPIKSQWNTHAQLYPIPTADLIKDPNLLPQNDGYE